jgi:hypothetical protein
LLKQLWGYIHACIFVLISQLSGNPTTANVLLSLSLLHLQCQAALQFP